MIEAKRIYDDAHKDDGFRILVDRLWPRGLSKEEAKIGLWLKEIAPSHDLREWFAHDSLRWPEFKRRYFNELEQKKELIDLIVKRAMEGKVTLLFAARNTEQNNAVALKEYIESHRELSNSVTVNQFGRG